MSRCPSDQQLEQFLEARVSDADQASIAKHVDRCQRCQAKLEELTGVVVEVASAAAAERLQSLAHAPGSENSADFLARLKQNPPSSSKSGQCNRSGQSAAGRWAAANVVIKPPVVANYEILSEVGRGGMGVVYKARQLGLDRLVALKMILAGPHAGPRDLVRFRQEAEAVARLRHPNIIQIYDIGESEGRPYLALEFVEGSSLAQLLKGAPQPLYAAARLVESLAEAIHYAHQRNIVHRDLKPANILLQVSDNDVPTVSSWENAADTGSSFSDDAAPRAVLFNLQAAVPKITDFGLAKRMDEGSRGTQSGDIVGTPSYMAPEQAGTTGLGVGPATDVYALGAILYELLTGRPPFRGPTSLDTVLLVMHEDPVRPSYLRRDLPRDLETIILKCLAKEPSKRYATAEALAQDLHRFRKGKPIMARPVGVTEWLWKWARHRPMTAALTIGMILLAVVSFAVITWQWQEARLARDDMAYHRELAEDAQRNADEQRKKAGASLYYSRISQSQNQWRLNDFPSAKQSLANCRPEAGEDDHRGWEWHYLQSLFHNDLFTLPHSHVGQGGWVAFDPTGSRIASVISGESTGFVTLPAEVIIWDAATGKHIQTLNGPSNLHRLAFSPDGSRLALATSDGMVMVWDSLTGEEILRNQMHKSSVTALAYSADGQFVASAGWDKVVKIWNASTGKVLRSFPDGADAAGPARGQGHEDKIQCVAFNPQKKNLVASASWDHTVKIWDLAAPVGTEPQTLRGHDIEVFCVAFSPDGKSVVSAAGNGNLKIWNLETRSIVQSVTGDAGAVLGIAYSPDDGRYLAKAGKDGTVRIWHVATGIERMSFRGHTAPVECVQFSPDCRRVVSISPSEGVAKVWDFTRHPEFATFARTDANVEAIAFSDNGQRLFSVTSPGQPKGGKLQVWDGLTGMLLEERLLPLNKSVLSPGVPVSFAVGGKYLAGRTEKEANVVKIWSTADGAEKATFKGHTLPVYCVRFSGDGKYLATAGCSPQNPDAPHEIKVWDAATGRLLKSFLGKGRVFNLAFDPAGSLLAFSGQEGVIGIVDWQGRGGRAANFVRVAGHRHDVSGLVFSGDGLLLASAEWEDRAVKIWSVEHLLTGEGPSLHTIAGPRLMCDLAFSPDNRRLAAISRDMVKLWEVDGGHEVLTLRGAAQRYWDPDFNPRLAFSPDGTQLAGSNWDKSISTWEALPLDSEEQFARFQEKRRKFADQRTAFWHLQEAELCLHHGKTSAAAFHLERSKSLAEPLESRWKRANDEYKKH